MFTTAIRVLLWVGAAAATIVVSVMFVSNTAAPGPINDLEPVIHEQAARIESGRAPFVEPAPGSPGTLPALGALSGLTAVLFGDSPIIPRVLTLVALLGAAALLCVIVRRETENWTYGVASGGLLLAGYALLGDALAGARPEPFMLLMLLAAGEAMRRGSGVMSSVGAGALLSLAAFTHWAALVCAVLIVARVAIDDPRRSLSCAATLAVLFGGGHVALSLLGGPWFNFAAWDAAILNSGFEPLRMLRHVGQVMLGPLGVLTLMVVMSFALPIRPWQGPMGIWGCIGGGLLAIALFSTQTQVDEAGAVVLSVAALALAGPLSLQRVTQHLAAWPGSTRVAGQSIVLSALALQFVALGSWVPWHL